jgi:signal transduction histidine kinase
LGELVNVLLDNACKYSQPGTPITVRLRQAAGEVCLEVEDQGAGISEQDRPHLFKPFFRSPRSRQAGVDGLGLGLSIASRLATVFRGRLEVSSQVGKGSCFRVRLPLSKAVVSKVTGS